MVALSKKPAAFRFTDLCANAPPSVERFSTRPLVFSEIADHAPGENVFTHTGSATIRFSDRNASDTHSASVVPLPGPSHVGSFSLGPVDQAHHKVTWNFKVGDGELDHLQAGETLVQKYKITIADGHGGRATHVVTIKLIGTNDAPIITSQAPVATVTELSNADLGENQITHLRNGQITFTDADTLDTHSASVVPDGAGYLGTLTLDAVNQASDSVGWTFKVADSVLEGLAAGETITQRYTVTINDGHHGTVSQTITVVIVGTNNPPVADDEVNTTAQDTPLVVGADQGVLVGDTDPDGGPLSVTSFTVAGSSTEYSADSSANIPGIGSLTLNSDGSYAFSPDPGFNGPVPVITYTVSDGNGGTDQGTLTIDVTPPDGPLEITGLSLDGPDATVHEANLADGTSPAPPAEDSGVFTIFAADGIKDLTIGGHAFITNGSFSAGSFVTPLGNALDITAFDPSTGEVNYTYTLDQAVDHDQPAHDTFLDESFAVVLTDADAAPVPDPADIATATLTVRITDDSPIYFTPAHDTLDNCAGASATAALDADGNIDPNYGADGGSIRFASWLEGADSALTSGGVPVLYHIVGDTMLEGKAGNAVVFTVTLNPDHDRAASNDTYTVTMNGALDNGGGCGGEHEDQEHSTSSNSSSKVISASSSKSQTESETQTEHQNEHGQGHQDEAGNAGVALNFLVPVEIVDGDGDKVSSYLSVTVNPVACGCGEHEDRCEDTQHDDLVCTIYTGALAANGSDNSLSSESCCSTAGDTASQDVSQMLASMSSEDCVPESNAAPLPVCTATDHFGFPT